jgi:hypothetical protein
MVNDGRSDNEADDGTVSYTIRNIPGYLDYIITSQAASAGKPKTTWLRSSWWTPSAMIFQISSVRVVW